MMKKHIWWRGWHLCPLLDIGKYTLWLTSGIAFGVKYNPSGTVYYLGWLVANKKTKHDFSFVEKVNARIWPEGWCWIITEGKRFHKA